MKYIFPLFLLAAFLFGVAFLSVPEKVSETKETATSAINWYSMEEAQQLAGQGDKKVLIYLEAQWCGYCNKMEREVFPKEQVQKVMHQFYYPVRVDVDSEKELAFKGETMSQQQFANRIRVSATPTFLFIDGDGSILGQQPGFLPEDVFKALLSFVGDDHFKNRKFEEYLKEQQAEG